MEDFLPDNNLQFINESADQVMAESADLVDFLTNANDLIEMNDVGCTSENKVIMRLGLHGLGSIKFPNLDQFSLHSYLKDDAMSVNDLLNEDLNFQIDQILSRSPLPSNESPISDVFCSSISFKDKNPTIYISVMDKEFCFNVDRKSLTGSIGARNDYVRQHLDLA